MKAGRPRPKLSGLPRGARAILAAARTLASERGLRLYLAGGVVRDLLSGRPVRDVDLVVDADAAHFAHELAAVLGASVRVHERFGTAVLTLSDGQRVDVASTRRETYASPGALPTVAFPVPIEADLARRDFTVNAMALELAPGRRLVDPHGGAGDLARGTLRALHPDSFLDDPTRALRAVRYANRYGFRLDARTRRAIARAVDAGSFARVSGDRLRRELVKILDEPGRPAAVARLQRLGLDRAIAPDLARAGRAGARLRLRTVERSGQGGWLAYLLAWLGPLDARGVRRVAERLGISGGDLKRVLAWPATRRRLGRGIARRRRSELMRRSAGLSRDELAAAAAGLASPADRRVLRDALAEAATATGRRPGARLPVTGADLVAAGVAPGAAIGRALSHTRDALLDGRISEGEALAFALRAARLVGTRP